MLRQWTSIHNSRRADGAGQHELLLLSGLLLLLLRLHIHLTIAASDGQREVGARPRCSQHPHPALPQCDRQGIAMMPGLAYAAAS